MNLSLGFSPCPNDTFMFDALVNQKLTENDFIFDLQIADVEALNKMCLKGALDISKLSYHAFAHVSDTYQMLTAGSALGRGVGPLLITKMPYNLHDVDRLEIAIPGKYTTANFLLGCAFPEATNLVEASFEEIEELVINGEVDAGLIIHENRFTYESKGLLKVIDLGEFWEQKTGLPIPLGGIAVKRSLPQEVKEQLNDLVQASVEFAFKHPKSSAKYVSKFAQEMDPEVLAKHIHTYVNPFSINLGIEGKAAIIRMFEERSENISETISTENLFVK